ncbi:MAG: UPF0280 family protein [Youngiibacter sp.]|nr:UPF0280 family protein [Youngiibacter sp.]
MTVIDEESDLDIQYSGEIKEIEQELSGLRDVLKKHIKREPEFLTCLTPIPALEGEHPMVSHMKRAAEKAGVGPMAAVAGAVAEYLGNMHPECEDLIIENGGDLYVRSSRDIKVLIYAGNSPLSNRIALEVKADDTPLGICTSSGTVGHSLSFGKADAVVIVSKDTLLADAAATAAANRISAKEDIQGALEFASGIEGVLGAVAVIGSSIGFWGNVKVVPVRP